MRCAVYRGPGVIELDECPELEIGPGEVLIRVLACGVCMTDIKTVKKGHPLIKPPCVLGHEVAGRVEEVGEGVSSVSPGDLVVAAPYVPCGVCYFCRRGQYTLCERLFEHYLRPGGFAELVAAPAEIVKKGLYKIKKSVPPEVACLTEPLACCLHGIRNLGLEPADTLLIVGSGPMGLMHLLLAKSFGAAQVIVTDLLEDRLKIATELGADAAINARGDVQSAVREFTDGRGADKVVVAVGVPEAISTGLASVRRGGTVLLFGGCPPGSQLTIDPNQIHYGEVTLVGSFGFTPRDFHDAARLIEEGRVRLERIVTHKAGLDRLLELVEIVSRAEGLKAVVTP